MEEPNTTSVLTPAVLSSMKRSELQKLCKKYGIKANGKNTDLQKKLQRALNPEGNMEDVEMTDVDFNPDLDKSSSRNRYMDSVSEPTTPQTPSAIPLEQQNKVRISLVEDSPINIKTTYQHEIKAEIVTHENKPIKTSSSESPEGHLVSISAAKPCLALIPYNEFIFSSSVKELEDNESKTKDANIHKLVTDTDDIVKNDALKEIRVTEHLVSDEKNGLNTIASQPLNSVIEQVEINKPHVNTNMNMFISPLKPSIPIEPRTPPAKHVKSVETERASTNLMARLTATPIIKSGTPTNSLLGSCPKTGAGPELDKNSPFITRETKFNFETMMQNSLQIQEEKNRAEDFETITQNSLPIQEEKSRAEDFETMMQNSLPIREEKSRAEGFETITQNSLPIQEEKSCVEDFDTMAQNSLPIQGEKSRAEDFETMTQNSLPVQEEKGCAEDFETMTPIQEEKSRAEDTEKEDPMDVCDEQSKSIEIADVPLSNNKNIDIIASVHEELRYRVAQLKALPSPERKRILGLDNVKTEIPMLTPFKNNNGASSVKQSPSSTNRFTQVHEKNFSKMPSIATHYAAQKAKNVEEETQDEVNRKRKDPDNMQSSVKKQKLAHSIQDGQVTKTKDIYKKVEKEAVNPVVKKTYDRNRSTINNRSSTRTKDKNVSQAEVQASAGTSSKSQESLKKSLSYIPHRRPVKSIIPNPEEQRKKEREEFEKRKQAARNVAQPVLEKMKNQRRTKENIPKELHNSQNGKVEEKSKVPSLLPKKIQ